MTVSDLREMLTQAQDEQQDWPRSVQSVVKLAIRVIDRFLAESEKK
jgi:hypothetical protein